MALVDGTVFLTTWTNSQQQEGLYRLLRLAQVAPETYGVNAPLHPQQLPDADFVLFAETFNAKRNIEIALSHKAFIVKTFQRFEALFNHLNLETCIIHDNSKVNSFTEVVGYTERWVHNNAQAPNWEGALQHHLKHNSHHPEFRVDPITGTSMEMFPSDLEESIVDMLAIQWERRFQGDENTTAQQLADVNPHYLNRYNALDRPRAQALLDLIAGSGL